MKTITALFTVKPAYLIVCSLVLLLNHARGQEYFHGLPAMNSYTSEHYHSIDQMWDAVQDDSGVMYFGNTNGIVRFDGNTWELIPVSRFMSIIRSMEKNSEGTLFIGSINNFGYLQASPNGSPEFISLVSQLPPGRETFNDIWHIACLKDITFFMTSRFLFVYRHLKLIEIVEAKERFTCIETIGGRVYVHDKGTGILTWDQNILKPFAGGAAFRGDNLAFIVAYDAGTLLAGTTGRGIFLLDEGKVTPWGDSRFRNKTLIPTCGIFLSDNTLAVGTSVAGIIHMNRKGEIIRRTGIREGMISNGITNLFVDRDKNLWVTTENGITHLEICSPFSYCLKPYGLTQPVMESAWFNHHVYLAGTDGVYAMPWYRSEDPLEAPGFHLLEGSSGQSWQIRSDGRQLYIPHNPGLLTIQEPTRLSPHPLTRSNVYGIVFPASSPGKLIASVDNGLRLIDKSDFSHVPVWTGKETPRYLILNADDELWMITETLRGIYRLLFSDDFLRVISQTWYSTHKGLPDIPVLSLIQDAGDISVLTELGLYRYNPVTDRFFPDSVCNRIVRQGAYLANTDRQGNLWLEGMNYLSKVNRDASGACRIQDTIFRWISPYSIFHTTSLPDGSWLFSTNKGVIHYDSTRDRIPVLHQPLITRVEAWGGDSIHFRKGFFAEGLKLPEDGGITNETPVLPFSTNSIRFLCASGCYGESRQYRFRFKLETAGAPVSDWSEWSSSSVKEYTNIPEGTHTFRVITQDIFGQISPERTFRFEILPPWYRTIWAYGVYFLLFFLAFYLAIRINARHLKRANLKLEQTVRDRTREIERQKTEIESLNEFKSRFFSNISHELRTPLTLVLSPLEQMEEEIQTPLNKKRLSIMLRNGRKLLNRINQLLDLARLEKGGIRLMLQEEELNRILAQIIEPFSLFAAEKRIRIIYREEHSGIRLFFDRDILEKIMDNLLSNALKFTQPGGEITIMLGLTSEKKQVRIIVRDTGTGIAEEELARIFDRFYQVGESQGGTGIGLAFVKELVSIHQGSISVESTPGKGTAFTLLLPADLQPDTPDASSPGSADHPTVIADPAVISACLPESADPPDKPSGNEIILVVEDNKEMLQFIAESLSDRYRVLTARDGDEGLAVSRKEMPDLIITDVMMPKMDGFAFTRSIRSERLTSHIPVIMLTAKSSIDSRIEGLEASADDYLTKPFSIRELMVRIRNLLSLRKMLQQKYRDALLIDPSEVVTNKMDEAFLTKAIRLVEEHMGEPDFGVELLYREMAMSRSSLHKKLKALTNQSATEFINTIRLKEAARQLRQQSGTVSEIAYSVGFSSIAYFNVCFKRVFGMNPTQYASSGKP